MLTNIHPPDLMNAVDPPAVPPPPCPALPPHVDTFFIDAPGGYGKSFVSNLILAAARSRGLIALAVASSGIAALLMDGGTTAHSRLKIPIPPEPDGFNSRCRLPAQHDNTKLIKAAHIIIWDEAPMTHKDAFGALDKSLRVRDQSALFLNNACLISIQTVVMFIH